MRSTWRRIACPVLSVASILALALGATACSSSETSDELLVYNAQHESLAKEWIDAFGGCVPSCPPNQVLDFYGIACHPIKVERRLPRR